MAAGSLIWIDASWIQIRCCVVKTISSVLGSAYLSLSSFPPYWVLQTWDCLLSPRIGFCKLETVFFFSVLGSANLSLSSFPPYWVLQTWVCLLSLRIGFCKLETVFFPPVLGSANLSLSSFPPYWVLQTWDCLLSLRIGVCKLETAFFPSVLCSANLRLSSFPFWGQLSFRDGTWLQRIQEKCLVFSSVDLSFQCDCAAKWIVFSARFYEVRVWCSRTWTSGKWHVVTFPLSCIFQDRLCSSRCVYLSVRASLVSELTSCKYKQTRLCKEPG
jgi:hypothetical protein